MEFTCKDFKVGKCEDEKVVDGETMPLVLQPSATPEWRSWWLVGLRNNKDWFDEMMIKKSDVLLRGLVQCEECQGFQRDC